MATDRELEAIIEAAEAIAEEAEERGAEGDTYPVSSVSVGNLIAALSGFGKFESPSPETPGLREAAKNFVEFVQCGGKPGSAGSDQVWDDLLAALDTPPNREGAAFVFEGESKHGQLNGEIVGDGIQLQHMRGDIPPGPVRIEITPLGESGGEQ